MWFQQPTAVLKQFQKGVKICIFATNQIGKDGLFKRIE